MATQYDFIIIGTGAGGGTLAHRLASSGKKILILERGTFLPREKENWDTIKVFRENRYHNAERWYDNENKELHPGAGYWVGGNTKVYGAALFRLRERDFEQVNHIGGVSPEWPLKYSDLEPYYCQAEKLYQVHGQKGIDPTEPFISEDYPHPPVSNEPRIQQLHDNLAKLGHRPFPVPVGIKLNEVDRTQSECIRCDTCDGFPCLVHAKSDADINCVRPLQSYPNVTLLTSAKVTRIVANATGTAVERVEAEVNDDTMVFSGDIVVVAGGAVNSAALLLRSADTNYPNGLANSSDQVGRNFMLHQSGAILSIGATPNPSKFMKTFSVNTYYWGEEGFDYPMGNVQLVGSFNYEMMRGDAPPMTPGFVLHEMASHAVPWWMTSEDLPAPENRVTLTRDGAIKLNYKTNNEKAYDRLIERWTQVLKAVDGCDHVIPLEVYFKKRIPLEGVGHQNGTCRFGNDPKTSVLDVNCKTHDLDNLYVVDGAFFASSAAVNPSLTIMANALRVGDHLIARTK